MLLSQQKRPNDILIALLTCILLLLGHLVLHLLSLNLIPIELEGRLIIISLHQVLLIIRIRNHAGYSLNADQASFSFIKLFGVDTGLHFAFIVRLDVLVKDEAVVEGSFDFFIVGPAIIIELLVVALMGLDESRKAQIALIEL